MRAQDAALCTHHDDVLTTADASAPCGFSRLGYSATAPICHSAALQLRSLLLHGAWDHGVRLYHHMRKQYGKPRVPT